MRLAIELDVLGDTRPLWRDWLADAARVLDVEGLPDDRAAAAAELDARGAGNWRTLLERFAEDRAPVYLRPAAEVSAALRRLQGEGVGLPSSRTLRRSSRAWRSRSSARPGVSTWWNRERERSSDWAGTSPSSAAATS